MALTAVAARAAHLLVDKDPTIFSDPLAALRACVKSGFRSVSHAQAPPGKSVTSIQRLPELAN